LHLQATHDPDLLAEPLAQRVLDAICADLGELADVAAEPLGGFPIRGQRR
jgi:hypothetical protein